MINKLRLLGTEMKNSIWFLIIVAIEIFVCIILLSFTLAKFSIVSHGVSFYNLGVAKYTHITTRGSDLSDKNTVAELKDKVNLKNLASCTRLGLIPFQYKDHEGNPIVTYSDEFLVYSPILYDTFKRYDIKEKLGKKVIDGVTVYDAYISRTIDYKIGVPCDVELKDRESVRINPVAYLPDNGEYFNGSSIETNNPSVMIFEDLDVFPDLVIEQGIFVDDNPPSYYANLGFNAKSVKDLFNELKSTIAIDYDWYLYMSIIAIIFVSGSIICMYMININNMARVRTVNYICGMTTWKQLLYEIFKMVLVFTIAMVTSYLIMPILLSGIGRMYLGYYGTSKEFFKSAGIVFGVYVVSLIAGMIKYMRTNAIKIINNEH